MIRSNTYILLIICTINITAFSIWLKLDMWDTLTNCDFVMLIVESSIPISFLTLLSFSAEKYLKRWFRLLLLIVPVFGYILWLFLWMIGEKAVANIANEIDMLDKANNSQAYMGSFVSDFTWPILISLFSIAWCYVFTTFIQKTESVINQDKTTKT